YLSLPPDALPTSGPASVELWFKTGSPGVLYSYQSGMLDTTGMSNWNPALYVGTDGRLHGLFFDLATANSDPMVRSGVVNDTKWQQAVLTGTGTSEALFLDGVQVGSENAGGKLFYNGGPYAYLGAGNVNNGWPNAPAGDANGANFFNGLMAE